MPDSVIGQPIDRVDGTAKVTGAARYAADTVASRTPAVGVILTSTIGHGRIAAVDDKGLITALLHHVFNQTALNRVVIGNQDGGSHGSPRTLLKCIESGHFRRCRLTLS